MEACVISAETSLSRILDYGDSLDLCAHTPFFNTRSVSILATVDEQFRVKGHGHMNGYVIVQVPVEGVYDAVAIRVVLEARRWQGESDESYTARSEDLCYQVRNMLPLRSTSVVWVIRRDVRSPFVCHMVAWSASDHNGWRCLNVSKDVARKGNGSGRISHQHQVRGSGSSTTPYHRLQAFSRPGAQLRDSMRRCHDMLTRNRRLVLPARVCFLFVRCDIRFHIKCFLFFKRCDGRLCRVMRLQYPLWLM